MGYYRKSIPLYLSPSIHTCVGWKDAQLTPRSCPSSTYLTTASFCPNRSDDTARPAMDMDSASAGWPDLTVLRRRPDVSHTRTVWSSEADTMRSSRGWKDADMT